MHVSRDPKGSRIVLFRPGIGIHWWPSEFTNTFGAPEQVRLAQPRTGTFTAVNIRWDTL